MQSVTALQCKKRNKSMKYEFAIHTNKIYLQSLTTDVYNLGGKINIGYLIAGTNKSLFLKSVINYIGSKI